MTTRELTARQKELNSILRNLDPNTKEYKELNSEMLKIKARQKELRVGMNKTGNSIGKMADKFNRFIGMGTAFVATITGMIFSMKEWIRGLVQLDDALANVMKTTGLTRKETRELYSEFKYLNTRTPRKELMLLAEQAGRLGKKIQKRHYGFC